MKRFKNISIIITLALVLIISAQTGAQQSISSDQLAALTLKIMTFDRNLEKRAGGQLVIGILYNEQDQGHAKGLESAFSNYKDKKVNGLAFKVVPHAFIDMEELKSWMASENVSVLYLSPSLLGMAGSVHQSAVQNECLTFGGNRLFPEAGTGLGLDQVNGKATIFISLDRVKKEGVDFSSDLLKMAKLI